MNSFSVANYGDFSPNLLFLALGYVCTSFFAKIAKEKWVILSKFEDFFQKNRQFRTIFKGTKVEKFAFLRVSDFGDKNSVPW